MEFDGIPIPYLNDSLISVAKRYGIYRDREDIPYSTNYQFAIISNNSFVEIIKDINTLTQAIYQGANIYVPDNYKLLFGKACQAIALQTNINAYAIAEVVKNNAKTKYQKELAEFEAKKREARLRAINEAERQEKLEEFLRKVDFKMAELVRELRITVSKAYKPFAVISIIAGIGFGSWFFTQYWIKEKSAQAELANVHNQNLILTAENKELSKYKDIKSQIKKITQELELLKNDNNKIKTENERLKQENTRFSNENDNLRNRIERCNSGFIRFSKC